MYSKELEQDQELWELMTTLHIIKNSATVLHCILPRLRCCAEPLPQML